MKRATHPRDVVEHLRAAVVELEIEVNRLELSGGASNEDALEGALTCAAMVGALSRALDRSLVRLAARQRVECERMVAERSAE